MSDLEVVGFECVTIAGKSLDGTAVIDFHLQGPLRFGARFAKHYVGGERFVVNLRDQIRFGCIVFLPNLTDLNFPGGHTTNVRPFVKAVNIAAHVRFPSRTRMLNAAHALKLHGHSPHIYGKLNVMGNKDAHRREKKKPKKKAPPTTAANLPASRWVPPPPPPPKT